MVADRRRIVASFRRRGQIIWVAGALLTVVGAAVAMAQPPTGTPTQTMTATAAASPTPDDRSPTPSDRSPTPGDTSPAFTPPATPTATTADSLTPTGAPLSTPSEPPTPGASPTSVPAQPESPPPQRPATPPASSTGAVPLSSVLIALAVLVLVSLVLLRLARKGEGEVAQPEAAPPRSGTELATDVLVLLASAGEALIDSGFDVDDVDANLEDIARAYGMADTEIIALPTALLVSSGTGGRLRTRAVTSGRQRLRLHQIEELDDVVRAARTGRIDPRWAHDQIVAIRTRPAPFGPSMQVVGQVLATVGLAVLLGSSWLGIVVAAGLGGVTGALLLAGSRVPPRFQVLLTVAASFNVSLLDHLDPIRAAQAAQRPPPGDRPHRCRHRRRAHRDRRHHHRRPRRQPAPSPRQPHRARPRAHAIVAGAASCSASSALPASSATRRSPPPCSQHRAAVGC